MTAERKLIWPDALNTRELGGYETADGRTVSWHCLVRSSNLDRLTTSGQSALLEYGIRTIIDLRTLWEAANYPNSFQNYQSENTPVYYQNIPLMSEGNETFEKATKNISSYHEQYGLILQHFPGQVAEIFHVIARAEAGGILFYCHAGKDRTGIIAALLLALLRVSPDQIDADYVESEVNVRPLLDEWLARVGDDLEQQERQKAIWSAKPGTMLSLLAFLEREYGSVEAYLIQAGVTTDELESIRGKVLI